MQKEEEKKKLKKEFPNKKSTKEMEFDKYMWKLHEWHHGCQMQRWLWSQQMFMRSIPMQSTCLNGNPPIVAGNNTLPAPPLDVTQVRGYRIPSLFRRLLAETIDFLILLTFKLLFLWMLMTFMGINAFQISFQLMLVDEINFDQIDDVYSDELQTMLIVALIYRTMCCLYEFIFVWLRGATPGKSLMGLKVVALNNRTQLAPRHAAVMMAGGTLNASNAWTRSFVKNLSIAFMIPTFITALFYSYKRTSYDIIAGTIVVKKI